MNDEDKAAMEKFGITYEQKLIFTFQGHKYERLADAVKYAELAGKETENRGNTAK